MLHQTQLELFDENLTAEKLIEKPEGQWLDRKSFRINAQHLADSMIGFANADGGRIVVGVHNGQIEGVNSNPRHLNDLLQAALDFSCPPVRFTDHNIECINQYGVQDRLLLLDIEASEAIHRNVKNECYLRVGDENRKLGPTEERELAFDKGEAAFDSTIVRGLDINDLDQDAIQGYAERMGVTDIPKLLNTRGLLLSHPTRGGVTQAGWMLFGNTPPVWCYIRFLHYAGKTIETGEHSNLTEDIRLDGSIPDLIQKARDLLTKEIGTTIRLTPGGRFERVPGLPEFAWLEAIVNAVTHRAYSLQGDGIRVMLFDDRLEVESPGRLPGLVRVQNIRNSRFSRNPHIARVLAEATGYVRELNEGVNRIFDVMQRSGLREPVFTSNGTGVKVILYTTSPNGNTDPVDVTRGFRVRQLRKLLGPGRLNLLLSEFKQHSQLATRDVADLMDVGTRTARRYLVILQEAGLIKEKARSTRDPTTMWVVVEDSFWDVAEGQDGYLTPS